MQPSDPVMLCCSMILVGGMQAPDKVAAESARQEEKDRLESLVLELTEVLTEMCSYTPEEVEEDSSIQIYKEAQRRIDQDSLPSYKVWAKENGILLPKTKKESYTMFKRKKYMRAHGLMDREHYSNSNRGKDRKSKSVELKALQKLKRKEIAAKRRQRREAQDALAEDRPSDPRTSLNTGDTGET